MYLSLSIIFRGVFVSAFDFCDVFWNIFFFGDVLGLLKSVLSNLNRGRLNVHCVGSYHSN